MAKITKEDALNYHAGKRPGKIEVVPTKPYFTQTDLSLAYSPGVAEPCLEIQKNPQDAYKYTDKGNLVAVISNGTAVLGLGDITNTYKSSDTYYSAEWQLAKNTYAILVRGISFSCAIVSSTDRLCWIEGRPEGALQYGASFSDGRCGA